MRESLRRPGVNFMGVEYTKRYWRLAGDRLRRLERANARIVHAEAAAFLQDCVDDESLSAVHIYFPDPWPKRRHHPRRFVQPGRVALLVRRMALGARLQIATDHAGYFAHIEKVVAGSSLVVVPFDPLASGAAGFVGTNFEQKYLREGRPVLTIAAEKRS